jgi:lipopolysaccharide transport system permease protein
MASQAAQAQVQGADASQSQAATAQEVQALAQAQTRARQARPQATRAFDDIVSDARNVRVWSMLAAEDIASRYRRTKLGPFWMTLSHGLMISGLALSFSVIMNRPVDEYFVYLAAGMTVWAFISSSLNDAPNVFLRGQPLMAAYEMPASIHIFRTVLTHMITFAHHMTIYVLALIFVKNVANWNTLWAIPGLLLVSAAATGWVTIFAFLGARFRDVTHALTSITTMLFMLTPIFWERKQLSTHSWIAEWNPLYYFIEVLRGPLLGRAPDPHQWLIASGLTAALLVVAGLCFVRARRDLTYWL